MSQPEYEAPKLGDAVPHQAGEDVDYVGETATVEEYPEPDWSEDRPIPVYIVSEAETPEITDWSSSRATVTDAEAVQLFGARRNRSRAILYNAGPDSIFLGNTNQLNRDLSFELALGEQVELKHNSSVWARCASTETAVVSWLQEYVVPLDD